MHFPLKNAYLCECGTVSDSSAQCPACANRCGLLNLSSVLDRKPLMAETQAIFAMLREVGKERIWGC